MPERHSQAESSHVALHQLIATARGGVRLACVLQDQRPAVGLFTPPIAVAVDVAIQIEQGFGSGWVIPGCSHPPPDPPC
jgi:hypothetical protein